MKKFIVFFAALSMVLGFAVTAAMADVDLYGSIRFRTYWVDKDADYSAAGGTFPNSKHISGQAHDDEDLDWKLGYLSRWGVKYKSGDIRGLVELDTRDGDEGEGSSEIGDVRVRHIYGEWDFGAGKLLIGQTFNPCTVYSNGLGFYAGGLQQFGGIGIVEFRTSQIRLTFGDLQLAFLTPDTEQALPAGYVDKDTTFPRIEARYSFKLDPVTVDFMGGYQTYEVVDANDNEESIDSYILGLYARANFGPAYVKGTLNYRQNGTNYGLWTTVDEAAVMEGGSVQDAETWGAQLVAGWKINDTFKVEAAYSMVDAENDDQALKNEDSASAYMLLCNIKLAPGVSVQPELIFEDQEDRFDNGVKTCEGDATIFGVFWMINFK